MRKLLSIGIVTLVFGYLYVLPCQAQQSLAGDWIGLGLGRNKWTGEKKDCENDFEAVHGVALGQSHR